MGRAWAWVLILVVGLPGVGRAALEAVPVASGLSSPVFVTAPAGDDRLFILERDGRIRVLDAGAILPTPFLDLTSQVSTLNTGGLLGLAFPDDHATSGLFYVYFTRTDGMIVLSRFQLGASPDVADGSSEEVLLAVSNPTLRHNGGTIAFSPVDGHLYLALGDGGGLYDPDEVAQDPLELRGKVLRVDPSGGVGAPLAIPGDNPFVGDPGTRDEIWALGLRNPYRWSFDRATGDMWIGDVGEATREEIDRAPASDPGGRNYGWDVMEGSVCNPNDPSGAVACNAPSLTLPVYEYDQSGGDCSVTGGVVNRRPGADYGLYFFGDFCSGRIWSMDPQTLVVTDRTAEIAASLPPGESLDLVAAIGEDGDGRLHVVDNDGAVFRLDSPAPPVPLLGLWAQALLGCGLVASAWRLHGR